MKLEHVSSQSKLGRMVETGRSSLFWNSLDIKTEHYLSWRLKVTSGEPLSTVVSKTIGEYDEYGIAAAEFQSHPRLLTRIAAVQEMGDLYNFCSIITYDVDESLPSRVLGV